MDGLSSAMYGKIGRTDQETLSFSYILRIPICLHDRAVSRHIGTRESYAVFDKEMLRDTEVSCYLSW